MSLNVYQEHTRASLLTVTTHCEVFVVDSSKIYLFHVSFHIVPIIVLITIIVATLNHDVNVYHDLVLRFVFSSVSSL